MVRKQGLNGQAMAAGRWLAAGGEAHFILPKVQALARTRKGHPLCLYVSGAGSNGPTISTCVTASHEGRISVEVSDRALPGRIQPSDHLEVVIIPKKTGGREVSITCTPILE